MEKRAENSALRGGGEGSKWIDFQHFFCTLNPSLTRSITTKEAKNSEINLKSFSVGCRCDQFYANLALESSKLWLFLEKTKGLQKFGMHIPSRRASMLLRLMALTLFLQNSRPLLQASFSSQAGGDTGALREANWCLP